MGFDWSADDVRDHGGRFRAQHRVLHEGRHEVCADVEIERVVGPLGRTRLSVQFRRGGGGGVGVMGVVVDFVSCLSGGVMRLIETSVVLDDVSLHHVINALTNLSQETMEIAYSNREPSLFAVAKLLEIGLVNLDRVEIYWRPLTNHLLEVCRHPHIRMREWGSEAITFLVRSALLHEESKEDKVAGLLLSSLCELSSVPRNQGK
ncbi:protein MON2 homolog [Folsomia candida]|nr:protein MON2 homolog [Folsomia candida]